jgi:hypothetical protein
MTVMAFLGFTIANIVPMTICSVQLVKGQQPFSAHKKGSIEME